MLYTNIMHIDKTTLGYIQKDDSFLMLFRNKKENDINKGKWVGVGGHIEANEDKDTCIIREVKEETGLDVINYQYRGELLFVSDGYYEIMYLYLINETKGELIKCDEGELKWIKKKDLLSLNMWEGDKVFLPLLIDTDQFIKLKLIYSNNKLIEVGEWDGIIPIANL